MHLTFCKDAIRYKQDASIKQKCWYFSALSSLLYINSLLFLKFRFLQLVKMSSVVRHIPIVRVQDTLKESHPLVASELAAISLPNSAGTSTINVRKTTRTTTRTVSRSRSVSPATVRVTVSRSPSPQPPQLRVTYQPTPAPAPVVVRTRVRSLSPLPTVRSRATGSLTHTGTRVIVSPSITGTAGRRRYIARCTSPCPTPVVLQTYQPPAPVRAPSIERFQVTLGSPCPSPSAVVVRSPSPCPVPKPPVSSPRIIRKLQACPTMSADSNLVCLRRNDTATAWGFRLNGGAEYGQPLYIYKVSLKNIY